MPPFWRQQKHFFCYKTKHNSFVTKQANQFTIRALAPLALILLDVLMPTDTITFGVITNYYYYCLMEKNTNTQPKALGAEDWANNVEHFGELMQSLHAAYALIADLKRHAEEKLKEFDEEDEELKSMGPI